VAKTEISEKRKSYPPLPPLNFRDRKSSPDEELLINLTGVSPPLEANRNVQNRYHPSLNLFLDRAFYSGYTTLRQERVKEQY